MTTHLLPEVPRAHVERLRSANRAFQRRYPGDRASRQPVHTVYGGAHLFVADSAPKLGAVARRALQEYAPDFATFARALGLPGAGALPDSPADVARLGTELDRATGEAHAEGSPALLRAVYARVLAKLRSEPVEDFRIDFEDGYGVRDDAEEDRHAQSAAAEVARALTADMLPPFIGIRVKPLTEEHRNRTARTLGLFLGALVGETSGTLPPNFVVTLPKVTIPEQVAYFVSLLETLEAKFRLSVGALRFEIMIETPQAILNADGRSTLPLLLDAARGRLSGAHFGTYDYTAGCGITAAHQRQRHPACDFARHMMQVTFAGTGVWLSDGSTAILPVPPHRAPAAGPPLGDAERRENSESVHRAWRLHHDDVRHSLINGFYQGWDLHPAQLPSRYGAVYAFFLGGVASAAERLRNFVDRAAQATLIGDVFDDAATGQGLLNFFLRAINCGAVSERETAALTGLSPEELRSRSFVTILAGRARRSE